MNILFVCLGNICRSPMAEALFRHKITVAKLHYTADSAGTNGWHAGELPDARALKTLTSHGIRTEHKARQVTSGDFMTFDLIVAMDHTNMKGLQKLQPDMGNASLCMLRDFDSENPGGDVPDPYFGNMDGFEAVYDMLDRSLDGLIAHLSKL